MFEWFLNLFPQEFISAFRAVLDVVGPFFAVLWNIIKAWWWLIVPAVFWHPALFLWLWWRRQLWSDTQKHVILEVTIPEEVPKPIRAMEHVFAGIHSLHDVVVFREKWWEGQYQLSIACEIVSREGTVHFYIRVPEAFRGVLESNMYAHYPDIEIQEVEDYVLQVPDEIPNKEWDVFGFDMINTKPNPYPMRSYSYFERETALESTEEKRIDPLAGLLEGMSSLGPGEHLWVQLIAKPIREEVPWVAEGREIVNDLVRRQKKEPDHKPMLVEASDILISGTVPGQNQKKRKS